MSLGSQFNFKDLPPKKKRVLALGGAAFVVLLFVSFLLSLSEDDRAQPAGASNADSPAEQTSSSPRAPNEHVYDFEQGQTQSQGGALEDLLTSPQPQAPQEQPAPLGPNNDPFAQMGGSRDAISTNPGASAEDLEQVFNQGSREALGPAPIPQEPQEPQAAPQSVLICDSFSDADSAESKKAILAFQGMASSVVHNQDGTYSLKLGPYDSAERGRSVFADLSGKGLLERCALVTQ